MLNVFIAGSSREIERVRHVYNQFMFAAEEGADINVTLKWWDIVEERGHGNPPDAEASERYKWSTDDLEAVEECDLFLLLVPPECATVGAYVELGAAYVRGAEIVCAGAGPDLKKSIYHALGAEFEHDESAVNYIIGCAKGEYSLGEDYTTTL